MSNLDVPVDKHCKNKKSLDSKEVSFKACERMRFYYKK